MRVGLGFVYVSLLAGCSIHHRSDELGDAGTDGEGIDGMLADAPSDSGGGIGGVPGLVLWLNGGAGVTHDPATNRVSRWADQSGNRNDAVPPGDGNAPTYAAQSINHQPGVHFGLIGIPNLTIADSSSLKWGTGDFVVAAVVTFKNPIGLNNPDGTPCFFAKAANATGVGNGITLLGNSEAGAGASGRIAQSNGTARSVRVLAPLNNGTPHAIALRRNADILELRVDGAVAATTTGAKSIDISTDQAAAIGSLFGGQAFRVDGDIDEVVAVTGTGATSHLGVVESYLIAKYGL
jgi:hypothetical protein